MKRIAYFAFLGLILLSKSTWAARVINLGDEFDQFVKTSAGTSREVVEAEWDRFESRHQYIYDRFVYRKGDSGWEQRKQKKRNAFFAKLFSIQDDMRAIFTSAERLVAEKEAAFRYAFPDMTSDIPVYFLPSLLSFNGKVGTLPEYHRSGLLMGVDAIVDRKDDMDVLFHHEFFHAYQDGKIEGPTGRTMATPLWFEGLATYVSGILNPDRSDSVLLMDDVLAEKCRKPEFVKQLARKYLLVIEDDGQKTYEDWFMGSGPTQPTRRGYCLGLQAMRLLSENHSLSEVVRWNEDRFSKVLSKVLSALSEQ